MERSPQDVIDEGRLSVWQMAAIAVTILLNALDGFDGAAISFAAPGLAAEWGVTRDVLGWVLSMELIGMAAGSIVLGGLADRVGRRPIILGSLIVMTFGMYMATSASSVTEMSVWRLLTGLGIGGMLATLTTVVAEYANARTRNIALSIMVVGYPLGGVIGGLIARQLLAGGDWRAVFEFGAMATAIMIPIAFLFIIETPAFLNARRPADALARINRTLMRFRLTPLDRLPDHHGGGNRLALLDIFRPGLRGTTILITAAYSVHIGCYYFIMKWTPKLVVDMGFLPAAAADVLVWVLLGAAIGGPVFGYLAQRFTLKATTIAALLLSFIAVNLFGHSPAEMAVLLVTAGLVGFFANSAGVGFYALLARAFPAHVRATGTGFALGVGRAGAALGPALAGMLLQGGMALSTVALLMSFGSLFAAIAIWRLSFAETTTPDRAK